MKIPAKVDTVASKSVDRMVATTCTPLLLLTRGCWVQDSYDMKMLSPITRVLSCERLTKASPLGGT